MTAACSPSPDRAPAPSVACARGDAPLAVTCSVEEASGVLTLRWPDGGFRRLMVTRDGRGVVATDGAEPARVAVVAPGTIEVAVAHERYRLPATIGGRR